MDVADWLRQLGLERYDVAFRENDITAAVLPNLTADDLKDLGVTSVGHRRQILQAIAVLRGDAEQAAAQNAIGDLRTPERRQLNVMFCDLMGFTELSSRLDPEDLSGVVRTYQEYVSAITTRFSGFIARYVGDGVLIYFGWPEAHEANAERAVRAALAIITAIGEKPVRGETLQVRIGIATGLVVVGETPNRAARLQGLAGSNGVAIDAASRQELGG